MRVAAVLSAILLLGCVQTPLPPSNDASAGAPADLSAANSDLSMAAPHDGPCHLLRSSGCLGAPFANTCVAKFFDAAIQCFSPSCACVNSSEMYRFDRYCWDDGAKEINTEDFDGYTGQDWSRNGIACLSRRPDPNLPKPSLSIFKRNNETLIFDDDKKRVTCPDGSTITGTRDEAEQCDGIGRLIRPDYSNPALVACTSGDCPP